MSVVKHSPGETRSRALTERLALSLVHRLILALPREFSLFLLAAVVFAGLCLLPPQLFHFFSRQLVAKGGTPSDFLHRLAIFGGLVALAMAIAAGIRAYAKEWLALRLEWHLRKQLLGRLHNAYGNPFGFERGEWVSRVSTDVRMTEEFLGATLPDFLYSLALVVGTATVLFFQTGWVALLPVFAAGGIGLINYHQQKRLSPALEKMRDLHAGIYQLLLENFEGWKTVRSHGAEAFEQRRIDGKLRSYTEKGAIVARVVGGILGLNELAVYLFVASCLLLSAWTVTQGRLTAEAALFYPFYLTQFFFSVRGVVIATHGWNRFIVHGARLESMLETATSSESVGTPRSPDRHPKARVRTLRLENLTVQLPGAAALLEAGALCLSRGEIVAVIGPSGSGKSTLLEIVAGLQRPRRGEWELQAENMSVPPMRGESPGATHFVPCRFAAYVDQKPYVFEGTVADNLRMGREQLSEAKLWKALECVALSSELVARGGLTLCLTDRGANLSEGQRYRLAIARALLLERPFLLLDEPFAALDSLSAAHLCRTLEVLRRSMGVLVVTHYVPHSLALDRVYRLGNGRLVELAKDDFESFSTRKDSAKGNAWTAERRPVVLLTSQSAVNQEKGTPC